MRKKEKRQNKGEEEKKRDEPDMTLFDVGFVLASHIIEGRARRTQHVVALKVEETG
jgi:hypothetical protein